MATNNSNQNSYYAMQGAGNAAGSRASASALPTTNVSASAGLSNRPAGGPQPIVNGNAAVLYGPRKNTMVPAPLMDPYRQLPQGTPARETYASASAVGAGSFQQGGHQGASNDTLHARDHFRMQPGHPALNEPIRATDARRIQRQAAAGCPQCQGFVAGVKNTLANQTYLAKQNVLDGNAETPSEQRLARSLAVQVKRAGDRAVAQLPSQPGESINARIAREAEARGWAEKQVRDQWAGKKS